MEQTNESVNEITCIFLDKAQFCLQHVATEEMKMNHYHSMLKNEIREFVSPRRCQSFDEMVEVAQERELELKRQNDRSEKSKLEEAIESSKKLRQGGHFQRGGGQFRRDTSQFRRDDQKRTTPPCKTCGKNHS